MERNELADRLESMARGEGAVQVADILEAAAMLMAGVTAERDAARYRWLRNSSRGDAILTFTEHSDMFLDESIDAALAKAAPSDQENGK